MTEELATLPEVGHWSCLGGIWLLWVRHFKYQKSIILLKHLRIEALGALESLTLEDFREETLEVELECSDCREEALVRESVTRWPIRRAPLHVIMLTCFKHYHFIKYLHHGTPSIQSTKPAEMR